MSCMFDSCCFVQRRHGAYQIASVTSAWVRTYYIWENTTTLTKCGARLVLCVITSVNVGRV